MKSGCRKNLFQVCGWLCWMMAAPAAAPAAANESPVQFNRDIRPILSDNCFHCHGPDRSKRQAGLRLDTPEGAFADLGGSAAIVPGNAGKSELVRRVTASDSRDLMPPKDSGRSLSAHEIALLTRWIEQGAPWEIHWAFQAPERPAWPVVEDSSWPANPIDYFVLAKVENKGLQPAAPASKETLIRRVTLDLTGLPPTPEEVDAFLQDESPDAYEKVVDRLLASPRYGERMALEWLDAARYSDSNGFQNDGTRTMWPWRDWVIEALNSNMPFDQFTIEQLAGDLLSNPTRSQRVATGFNRNHMLNGEGGRIAEESRVDYVVDRVDTTATVWLGLTMACAQCHDHKYDPISHKEYFQFFAYFNNVAETGAVDAGGNARPILRLPTPEQTETLETLRNRIAKLEQEIKASAEKLDAAQSDWEQQALSNSEGLPEKIRAILQTAAGERSQEQAAELRAQYFSTSGEHQTLQQQLDETRQERERLDRSVVVTMVMEERADPRDTFVLAGGAYDQYGEKVSPGVPAVLPPLESDLPNNRLGLARWLVHPDHPLTARVTVNRYWQQFFGVGLVKTVEDFGLQGEWPVNKELLDWLATEFVRNGWDVKGMHRLIVTSAAYRQSSRTTPELLEIDPENRLLARGPRFRLPSMVLRDQALAAGGLLHEKIGGPPVRPYQPPGIWEELSFGKISYNQDSGENLYRRSLYVFWRRTVGPTMFFDTSPRQVCTVRLPRTNTPLHALVTLNETGYVEAARMLAQRAMLAEKTPEGRLRHAFRLATARTPKAAEMGILQYRLAHLLDHYSADPEAALQLVNVGEAPRDIDLEITELAAYTGLANLILNLDEVLNKE